MDEQTSNSGYTAPTVPPVNRTIITIPKAVASMTSIPTKEDYRDYRTDTDDFIEAKQHRKESKARSGGLSRELRQLDLSSENDIHMERRRSIGSLGSNNSGLSATFDATNKRRGRPPRPSSQIQQQQPQQPTAPKLKIKIGTNSVISGSVVSGEKDRIRPPKKRLAVVETSNATFNVEDFKRESMKFRKKMIKDLKKKEKSEKKKKKLKPEVQIVESQNATKLIIRFGGSKKFETSGGEIERRTSSSDASCSNSSTINRTDDNNSSNNNNDNNNSAASDRLKEEETNASPAKPPLRLKLSRCQEGTGYIMKPAISVPEKAEETQAVQPGQPPPASVSRDETKIIPAVPPTDSPVPLLPSDESNTPAVVQRPKSEEISTAPSISRDCEVR